jgi:hypothetical protein
MPETPRVARRYVGTITSGPGKNTINSAKLRQAVAWRSMRSYSHQRRMSTADVMPATISMSLAELLFSGRTPYSRPKTAMVINILRSWRRFPEPSTEAIGGDSASPGFVAWRRLIWIDTRRRFDVHGQTCRKTSLSSERMYDYWIFPPGLVLAQMLSASILSEEHARHVRGTLAFVVGITWHGNPCREPTAPDTSPINSLLLSPWSLPVPCLVLHSVIYFLCPLKCSSISSSVLPLVSGRKNAAVMK